MDNNTTLSSRSKDATRITVTGSIVNVALSVGKLAAGIVGHSAAMVADSVHSFSDLATDVVVLATMRIARQPEDRTHPFGHGKFETAAAVIIGAALFFVGAGMLLSGVKAIIAYTRGASLEAPGVLALVAAGVSIVAKEALYRATRSVGRRIQSDAVVANAWHHRSDALSSIGAFVGIGGAILLGPGFRVLDPLAGVIVSVVICVSAFGILRKNVPELLERGVEPELEQRVLAIASAVAGVIDPHRLRMRRVGSYMALDLHIRVEGGMSIENAHRICHDVESALCAEFGAPIVTIHPEPLTHREPGGGTT